jgi:hypothetical protein
MVPRNLSKEQRVYPTNTDYLNHSDCVMGFCLTGFAEPNNQTAALGLHGDDLRDVARKPLNGPQAESEGQ